MLTNRRLNEILEEMRIAERKRKMALLRRLDRARGGGNREREREEEEWEERMEEARELLKGKLRQARVEDYKNWLAGFLGEDNKPTHCYDYPMESSLGGWKVALVDFEAAPLCGADALNIIVPSGIKFLGGKLGHSTLYFMQDFSRTADGWVPIYSDIHF